MPQTVSRWTVWHNVNPQRNSGNRKDLREIQARGQADRCMCCTTAAICQRRHPCRARFARCSKFCRQVQNDERVLCAYVPGWDHGLPIEVKVMAELGQKAPSMSKPGIRGPVKIRPNTSSCKPNGFSVGVNSATLIIRRLSRNMSRVFLKSLPNW